MPKTIWVAVLHAIGEDNEGNTALLAWTREDLVKTVLFFCNSAYGTDPSDPPDVTKPYAVEADLYEDYAVSWEEHELPAL